MVSQTTQASASSNKGFTLVELIVVITILAILGTIGFLSLQGYSAQSRDSKRTSDVASITKAVTVKSTEGLALAAFITGNSAQQLTTLPSVGWAATVLSTSYFAGTPNFTVLNLNAASFKDPNGPDYVMGSTTRAGGAFQVAATLESNSTKTALVNGTYNRRIAANTTTASIPTTSVNTTSDTISITSADIGKFRVGDVLTGSTTTPASLTVKSISNDGLTLSFSTDITAVSGAGTLTLAADEGTGLIKSVTANAVVSGDTTNYPY